MKAYIFSPKSCEGYIHNTCCVVHINDENGGAVSVYVNDDEQAQMLADKFQELAVRMRLTTDEQVF